MNRTELVGVCGKAGSGKDSISDVLVGAHGFHRVAFADALKVCAEQFFGVRVGTPKDDRVRRLYQRIGMLGREHDPGLWIGHVERRIDRIRIGNPHARFVVSDVRFENEARWIRSRGGTVWRVVRPGAGLVGALGEDVSETELDGIVPNAVIWNTGTLDDLATAAGRALDAETGAVVRSGEV